MIFSEKNLTPFDGDIMKEIEEGLIIADGEKTKLIEKSITQNGEYSASADGANGYSSVNVDVANTYTADDNGKVVSNQELVAQTAYPTEITENNTYDTTNYNSITVNVSGGGISAVAICTFDFSDSSFALEDDSGIIGSYAFNQYSVLTSVIIPNSVTSIGDNAFAYCENLETVTFESNSSLESIGESAFSNCCSLTSITIPSSVTSIGDYVFNECGNLETITFETNSNLETIGNGAFQYCASMSSITIPGSVTTIGETVFEYCTALSSITFEPTTPPTLNGDLVIDTSCTIRVPQGTLEDYTSADNYPSPDEYTYEEY